jgi:O-6-methylguanine DNA methyltransferase
MTERIITIESPIGPLQIEVDEDGALTRIEFLLRPERPAFNGPLFMKRPTPNGQRSTNRDLQRVIDELDAYFLGKRREFTMELRPRGTPFQLRVWNELTNIPYGETISYLELAERIGKPSAVRAVGAANGANPIPVIIPCHRVIGSSGKLIGYGGGLDRKETLLSIERSSS